MRMLSEQQSLSFSLSVCVVILQAAVASLMSVLPASLLPASRVRLCRATQEPCVQCHWLDLPTRERAGKLAPTELSFPCVAVGLTSARHLNLSCRK